ncbi:MAG: HIRAN domain-containing protein [Bacteroidales bacterium]|jgi:hypothetical protein|nr:HIRAN domain-containing protein [Bacteroidales bacterium]
MVDRHYATFHIAGFTYWDGVDVFDDLKIGKELFLEAEPNNSFDQYAVKILYKGTMLGYIPKGENVEISKFLQLGYTNLFSVKVSRVNPESNSERQIFVTIKINKKVENTYNSIQ